MTRLLGSDMEPALTNMLACHHSTQTAQLCSVCSLRKGAFPQGKDSRGTRIGLNQTGGYRSDQVVWKNKGAKTAPLHLEGIYYVGLSPHSSTKS